jgi:hypothetical protein
MAVVLLHNLPRHSLLMTVLYSLFQPLRLLIATPLQPQLLPTTPKNHHTTTNIVPLRPPTTATMVSKTRKILFKMMIRMTVRRVIPTTATSKLQSLPQTKVKIKSTH